MTHIFVWRVEDVFGLTALAVFLLVAVVLIAKDKLKQWRKKWKTT